MGALHCSIDSHIITLSSATAGGQLYSLVCSLEKHSFPAALLIFLLVFSDRLLMSVCVAPTLLMNLLMCSSQEVVCVLSMV